jgi:subtilisin family serine protease
VGLNNTGQNGGTPNVDINALEASAIANGDSNLVVAVIDDGVNFSHPELAGRAWTNPGEVPNNLDDDANGYVDDVNGWDFFHGDKTVHDPTEDRHGTHVSGTIAASIDGQGVVGVAPNVKVMALKFLGPRVGTPRMPSSLSSTPRLRAPRSPTTPGAAVPTTKRSTTP